MSLINRVLNSIWQSKSERGTLSMVDVGRSICIYLTSTGILWAILSDMHSGIPWKQALAGGMVVIVNDLAHRYTNGRAGRPVALRVPRGQADALETGLPV